MEHRIVRRRFHLLVTLCCLFSSTPVFVQAESVSAGEGRSQPTNTAAPTLRYNSVFDRYRGYDEVKVDSWRKTNDTVGRIGGWRYYAQEAEQTDDAEGTAQPDTSGQPKPAAVSPPEHKSDNKQIHNHEARP